MPIKENIKQAFETMLNIVQKLNESKESEVINTPVVMEKHEGDSKAKALVQKRTKKNIIVEWIEGRKAEKIRKLEAELLLRQRYSSYTPIESNYPESLDQYYARVMSKSTPSSNSGQTI